MIDFLTKILSKDAYEKAAELVQGQQPAANEEEATNNHKAVLEGLIAFVEDLDDKVELIPFAGPILKALVDSPAVDDMERKACEFVVETVYRALKYGDAL